MTWDWDFWLYLSACLAVPAAWGVVTGLWFCRQDRAKALRGEALDRRPPVDYSI